MLDLVGTRTGPKGTEHTWKDARKEFKVRFSNEVYPGDTLTTEGWKDKGAVISSRFVRAAAL